MSKDSDAIKAIDTNEPLEFKIKAAAWGYEISRYRGEKYIGVVRKRWLWLAKYYIWAYKRRMRKMGQI